MPRHPTNRKVWNVKRTASSFSSRRAELRLAGTDSRNFRFLALSHYLVDVQGPKQIRQLAGQRGAELANHLDVWVVLWIISFATLFVYGIGLIFSLLQWAIWVLNVILSIVAFTKNKEGAEYKYFVNFRFIK